MSDDDPGYEWFRFYNGIDESPFKVVCKLTPALCRSLSAKTNTVKIGRNYVQKSVHKHRFSFTGLTLLEQAILEGEAYLDSSGQAVFFLSNEPVTTNYLFVALKVCRGGTEVWVKSFHWKSKTDRNRVLKRSTKLVLA